MHMRQLTKVELSLLGACLETFGGLMKSTKDESEMVAGVKRYIKEKFDLDLSQEIDKLILNLKDNDLLLLDYEGDKPAGEIKIVEGQLTEYGQPETFKLKPMKFPYRKEDEP